MAERLAQMMRESADRLDVPPARATAALTLGRRLRRRRQVVSAVAAVVVVGGLALGGMLALAGHPEGRRGSDPVAPRVGVPAFGAGSRIFLGDVTATVPHTVHSLHYTSVGVLVRSNRHDGASEGSGPENLTLVRDDGTTVDLGTIPEGVGPATDPDQPYYVLAEQAGDGFEAVVRDAQTGGTVARVPLPDLPPSNWDVPPLSLTGDTVYVGYEASTMAVNWHTGKTTRVPGLTGGMPEVYGDRAVVSNDGEPLVIDTTTGETLVNLGEIGGEDFFASLSPDGHYVSIAGDGSSDHLTVISVASGKSVRLEGDAYSWGWTSTGEPFQVTKQKLTECDPDTGSCTSTPSPARSLPDPTPDPPETQCAPDGSCVVTESSATGLEFRLAGRTFES